VGGAVLVVVTQSRINERSCSSDGWIA